MEGHELGDPGRVRVRQEEIYREEIRKELARAAAPRTGWEKIHRALESKLGMWFLTSVLVSAIGAAYTHRQEVVRERQQQKEATESENRRVQQLRDRLTLEISFRLSSTLARLREIHGADGQAQVGTDAAIAAAFAPLALPASDAVPPLFPEFRSFTVPALLAELRRHSEPVDAEKLKHILTRTSKLVHGSMQVSRFHGRTAQDVATELLQRMRSSWWNNGFPYTDCEPANPFC